MNSLKEKQSSFRNLLIIALADGFLEQEEKAVMLKQAEQMGLRTEEVLPLFEDTKDLQFYIPKTQEDREKELKKLILMMLANEQISPSEYECCLEFAQKANIQRKQLDEWIDLFLDKENEYHSILRKNLEEYQSVLETITDDPLQTKLLIATIQKTATHKLPDTQTLHENTIRFLWILFIRAPQLDKRFLNQIPMYCELIREGRYRWNHFFSALIFNEKSNCNSPAYPASAPIKELLKKLQKFSS